MGVKEEALKMHHIGFNCAQSVIYACKEFYPEVDEKLLAAISAGFGGGVRCGEMCGAVSGAVMALGLSNPFCDGADTAAKDKIARLTKECTKSFKEKFDNLRCIELKNGGHSCEELIAAASELAEMIINNNR